MIGLAFLDSAPYFRDVITTGGLVVTALIGAVSAVQVALIQSGRKETKRARVAAQLAADRSEPTGNGYAKASLDLLRNIDARQVSILQRLDRHDRRMDAFETRLTDHLKEK